MTQTGSPSNHIALIRKMFYGASALTTLDLTDENFDTSAVTSMYGLFGSASALISLDLTGATIVFTFTKNGASYTASTTNGMVTLTDPANGVFKFNEQIISYVEGTYCYDTIITLASGEVKTYIKGTRINKARTTLFFIIKNTANPKMIIIIGIEIAFIVLPLL